MLAKTSSQPRRVLRERQAAKDEGLSSSSELISLDLIKASLAEAPPDGVILIFDTDRPTTQHSLTGWLFDFISPDPDSSTSPTRSRSLSTLGGIDTARDVTSGVCPLMVVANKRQHLDKWQWSNGEARLPTPPTWVDKFLVGEMSPRWASAMSSKAAAGNGMEAVRNKLLRFDSSNSGSETIFTIASLSDDTTTELDRRAWTELLRRSLRYHHQKLFGGV
ncbi:hypothetical protein FOL47_001092 [Perkinsus chesapeaki]|uniref:Uncharacterized protein n=1 Tax=Perkinsus chesapeaki TaxID=330153 RepID=A0A7J6MK12_PERCH|nr:hypothetical protein FOL47_001092 [Perkinsus chesapeaki]